MNRLIQILAFILSPFIGKFSWTPPSWALAMGRKRSSSPGVFYGSLIMLVLLAGGGVWGYMAWQNRPQPAAITPDASAIETPDPSEAPHSSPLDIRFTLTDSEGEYASVAPLTHVGDVVKNGVSISPEIAGEWRWETDTTLRFNPKKPWPAGEVYTVDMDEALISVNYHLAESRVKIKTPEFAAKLKSARFYSDPRFKDRHQVVATFTFSHPASLSSFKNALAMIPTGAAENGKPDGTPLDFSADWKNHNRDVSVISSSIPIHAAETFVSVILNKGVSADTGPGSTPKEIRQSVKIPGMASFFKVSEVSARIIRDEEGTPSQTLMVSVTDAMESRFINDRIQAWLLPKRKNRSRWSSPAQINKGILSKATVLPLAPMPPAKEPASHLAFRFDAPENQDIYVRIEPGLTSDRGFVMTKPYDAVFRAPNYPRELSIQGEGAVLPRSGEKTISFKTRGIPGIRVTIKKLLPGQIQHLISQTRGDLTNPSFQSWGFDYDNLAEVAVVDLALTDAPPSRATYSSVDLTRYLPEDNNTPAVFFLDAKGYDFYRNRNIYSASDKRLFMVSDLALLVKRQADDSRKVFVMSVSQGMPVPGVMVKLLGKNGTPVMSSKTNALGQADFQPFKGLVRSQEPVVFLAQNNSDIAFIPVSRPERMMNTSRFDTGGTQTRYMSKDQMSAFLFSDRGIYRPGDSVHVGAIVRKANFRAVPDLPVLLTITDPRGMSVKHEKLTLPKDGFIEETFPTHTTSPTGMYHARMYLLTKKGYQSRQIGSVSFKVDEFQPDRLKITSTLEPRQASGWLNPSGLSARVVLNTLYGPPAAGNTVKATSRLTPARFSFPSFPGVIFTDPFLSDKAVKNPVTDTLPDTTTDNTGAAIFALNLERFESGTYQLDFTAFGYEKAGGRRVMARNTAMVSPASYLVGYKPDGDLGFITKNADRKVDILAVNPDLSARSLSLTERRLRVDYVSSLVKQNDGTFVYQSVKKETLLSEMGFPLAENGTSIHLETGKPGEYVIELIGEGRKTLCRFSYTVAGSSNTTGALEKNAELGIVLDKPDYKPGELMKVQITAPYTGAGLVTIESDKVHAVKWFTTGSPTTMVAIRVPKNLEGNAYLNVAFIRSMDSPEIYISPLSFAVKPFTIDRSKRRITLSINTPEKTVPGKPLAISYKASKPCKLALFAVDEGILQVTRYKTPDPLAFFLKKRALEVETLQMVDLLLPEYRFFRAAAAPGGGLMAAKAIAKNLNPFARKQATPAVYWAGLVDADTNEKTTSWVVPETFNGTLRVMAVAAGLDRVGHAEKKVFCRAPFVVEPMGPLAVTPGDSFTVSASIANMVENAPEELPVDIRITHTRNLRIKGEATTTLTMSPGETRTLDFTVVATDGFGNGQLTVYAKSGDHESRNHWYMSVRPSMPHQTTISAGASDDGNAEVAVPRIMLPELAEQTIAAGSSPLVIAQGLSAFLMDFPHGCTEQLASRTYPVLGQIRPGHPVPEKTADAFAHTVDQLRARQNNDGGFSLWGGMRRSNPFASIHVMQLLSYARTLGLPVPGDMMRRGQSFLTEVASAPVKTLSEARRRAWAIYLVTQNGTVSTGYLSDLRGQLETIAPKAWKEDITAVFMAGAWQMMKKTDVSNHMIKGYEIGEKKKDTTLFITPFVQDSLYISTLATVFPERLSDVSAEDLMTLLTPLFDGQYNTVSAGYAYMALSALSRAKNIRPGKDNVGMTAVLADGTNDPLTPMAIPFPTAGFDTETRSVSIGGPKPLFYLMRQKGFDAARPETAVAEGIEVFREYRDKDGVSRTDFTTGDDITVVIRLRATEDADVSGIALIDMLPGGLEADASSARKNRSINGIDAIDVREDRVVFYGRASRQLTELTYTVRATASGTFAIPPCQASSMYRRHIRALSPGTTLTLTPGK